MSPRQSLSVLALLFGAVLALVSAVAQTTYSAWRDTDDNGGVQYRWLHTRILSRDACEIQLRDLHPNGNRVLRTDILARVDFLNANYNSSDDTVDLPLTIYPPDYASYKLNNCQNISSITLTKLARKD